MNGNSVAKLDDTELGKAVPYWAAQKKFANIHAVLALENGNRQHAWYEVKESRGMVASFVKDIETARQLSPPTPFTASTDLTYRAKSIGRRYRYALILSSLNSVASNISNRLLKALASSGIWTARQSFEYARHIPNEEQRADAIVSLGPVLQQQENLLHEALAEIRKIWTVRHRVAGIAGLAPYLSEAELVHALEMTLSLDDPTGETIYQHQALSALVSHLSPDQLWRMLDDSVLLSLGDYSRARLLVTASLRLADEDAVDALGLLERVLSQRDQQWLDAMSHVLVKVAQTGFPELALETAMYKFIGDEQLLLLADLIPVLAEPQLTQAKAIVDADIEEHVAPNKDLESEGKSDRLNLLDIDREARAALLPFLSGEQLQAAISWTLIQWEPQDGAEYVSRMADRLPDSERTLVYDGALNVLMSNADGPFNTIEKRARMLNKLIPLLPEKTLHQGFEVATRLLREDCDHFGYQIKHLAYETYLARSAIPTLDVEEIRRRYGPSAVTQQKELLDSFVLLAKRAPNTCLRPVVETFLSLEHVYMQLYTLTELIHHLELPIAGQVFELASQLYEAIQTETLSMNDAPVVSVALVKLAAAIPELSRDRALEMAVELAENMSDAEAKANLLLELAEYTPERDKRALVRSALDTVRAIGDIGEIAETLSLLAPNVPIEPNARGEVGFLNLVDDLFGKSTTEMIPNHYDRSAVLGSYLPLLAENGYLDVTLDRFDELMETRRNIYLASILQRLAKPEQFSSFTQTLKWARDNDVTFLWAKSVSENSQQLDNTLREQLARVILDECEVRDRIQFLPNLVGQLQPPLANEVQEAVISAVTDADRLSILALLRVCARFPSPLDDRLEDLLWQVLATELETGGLWSVVRHAVFFRGPQIVRDLYALRESLSVPAIEKVYSMVCETEKEYKRFAMTASLLPYLPESERSRLASQLLVSMDDVLTKYERYFEIGAPVQLLAAIVPYVSESEQKTAIGRLHEELANWRSEREASYVIDKLYWRSLEPLTELPTEILYDIWSRILVDIQDLDRTHLWNDTELLLPLLPALGGKQAVAEVCESIRVVARWWP